MWYWIMESAKYTTLIKHVNDLCSFDINYQNVKTFFQHEF